MTTYLLSVYQPGERPEPGSGVDLDAIMRDVDAVNREMREAGAWVFNAGLHAPSTATVVRSDAGAVTTTDGPFLEVKEFLGGLVIIRAEHLDAALQWGAKLAEATTLPIEVRPFQDA